MQKVPEIVIELVKQLVSEKKMKYLLLADRAYMYRYLFKKLGTNNLVYTFNKELIFKTYKLAVTRIMAGDIPEGALDFMDTTCSGIEEVTNTLRPSQVFMNKLLDQKLDVPVDHKLN